MPDLKIQSLNGTVKTKDCPSCIGKPIKICLKTKRISWADNTYSDMGTTDREDSAGALDDESISQKIPPEREIIRRVIFFQL